jgi:hypothetical protein
MTVSEHQLALDVDQTARLVAALHDRRRIERSGPARLLARLVAEGLDPRAMTVAAALALELDRPRETA